ncbi:aromatic-ring-hydroxylating dioxygenase subunit beta [Rhizorhabdus wittichii]|uniref:aromatic-ring-hydroxylating dioxygenase subunit beta n=1 Tax=Rhizorhabdus wittichii TaxID=160791 RepID=UPI000496B1CF|nr:aromatic-ring-hydroxylating dioxygenase subunit beta [Rhizorhabdus wittichii]
MMHDPEAIRDFVVQECELLDQGDFPAWLDLFDDRGFYWIPRAIEQVDPENEISLLYNSKPILAVRLNRLSHPRQHSIAPPYRSSHVVNVIGIDRPETEDGLIEVRSRFIMHEYHAEKERLFSGRFVHHLALAPGSSLKIRMKRVELTNCDAAFEPIEWPI